MNLSKELVRELKKQSPVIDAGYNLLITVYYMLINLLFLLLRILMDDL